MSEPAVPYPPPPVYGCYRHPDRPTQIGCQRCGRPICGECMLVAPVGFQCPDCVAAAKAQFQPQLNRARRAQLTRSFKDAPATASALAINLLVWLAITVTGGSSSRITDALALQATASCTVDGVTYVSVDAARCSAAGGVLMPGVSEGAWWQLLTSAFTHVSPMHIGFNMLALWFLGPQLERFLGRPRFVALYLLSALAGSVAVYWLSDPNGSTVGASGAVFGLMGALLVMAWRRGGDVQNILMWLGINVAFTFFGGSQISWQGHLGGLIGGAVVALVMLRERGKPSRTTWLILAAIAVALLVLVGVRTLLLA